MLTKHKLASLYFPVPQGTGICDQLQPTQCEQSEVNFTIRHWKTCELGINLCLVLLFVHLFPFSYCVDGGNPMLQVVRDGGTSAGQGFLWTESITALLWACLMGQQCEWQITIYCVKPLELRVCYQDIIQHIWTYIDLAYIELVMHLIIKALRSPVVKGTVKRFSVISQTYLTIETYFPPESIHIPLIWCSVEHSL